MRFVIPVIQRSVVDCFDGITQNVIELAPMSGLQQAIDIAGGVPELTRLCGYKHESRIRNWQYRGFVPGRQIPRVRAAVDYRVSAESLLEPVHSEPPV